MSDAKEMLKTIDLQNMLNELDGSSKELKNQRFAEKTCGQPHVVMSDAISTIGRVVTHIALKQGVIDEKLDESIKNSKLTYGLLKDMQTMKEEAAPKSTVSQATINTKFFNIKGPWQYVALVAVLLIFAGSVIVGMWGMAKIFLDDKPQPRHHVEQPASTTVKTP